MYNYIHIILYKYMCFIYIWHSYLYNCFLNSKDSTSDSYYYYHCTCSCSLDVIMILKTKLSCTLGKYTTTFHRIEVFTKASGSSQLPTPCALKAPQVREQDGRCFSGTGGEEWMIRVNIIGMVYSVCQWVQNSCWVWNGESV